MTGIANVGKVSEYQFHICNTANFFTSQKSKRVNLLISAVLVLILMRASISIAQNKLVK